MLRKTFESNCLKTNHLSYNFMSLTYVFVRLGFRPRTQAGLQAARARGRNGGRPKSLNSEKMALAIKLYDEKKHSVGQICRMMEISKPTLYKYIKFNKCHIS